MHLLSLVLMYVIRDFKRGRTVFFMVVISLSIATTSIMTTSGVLSGFQSMLERGAIGWLGDLVIVPAEDENNLSHGMQVLDDIKMLQYVKNATIRSLSGGALKYKEKLTYPNLVGLQSADEASVTGLPLTIVEGEFLSDGKDTDSIVLGLSTADALVGTIDDGEKIPIGSSVEFLTKDGTYKKYQVRGIIDGKSFYPNSAAFLQKDELEKISLSQKNHIILVKLTDKTQLEKVKMTLRERYPDMVVHTWQEESGYVEDILLAVRYITLLITTLLIFSVFIIISIVIFINIAQEKRQIGIMKSMGAKTGFIIAIYVCEALLYFILAYLCGFLLFGILHNYSVSHPASMPIGDFHTVIAWSNIILYFFILLFASLIGGFIPSYLITKGKIIDALRNV